MEGTYLVLAILSGLLFFLTPVLGADKDNTTSSKLPVVMKLHPEDYSTIHLQVDF